MTPATRQLAILRAALRPLSSARQRRMLRALRPLAQPVDPVGRVLLLICLLLRQDARGEACPISLPDLAALLGVDARQRDTYMRAAKAAGWTIVRTKQPPEPKRGRPPTYVHALLP